MKTIYSTEESQELQFPVQNLEEMFKLKVSIGICAHNEERNIGKLLDALFEQETKIVSINQIVVVSFSTDKTNEIVQKYARRDSRIKLVIQKKRAGKASAVNLFLKKATGDVLVLVSADTLPKKTTIENLATPFLDSHVGMTGGRPIPTNNRRKFMGAVSFLLWKLHDEVSTANIDNPKCGEIIAFRNVIDKIPKDTAVDEAWIEMAVRQRGFALRYAPEAVVYNHGPENISDFLKQRRRIHSGHLYLKEKVGYEVSTMKMSKIFKVIPNVFGNSLREVLFFTGAVFLEVYGRCLGAYDFYVKKKNPYVWDMATSTKKV
jgi:cellulose synthase/poly-beta-1,6-N-acetylglucosamine synthase-like glycosyltransferase